MGPCVMVFLWCESLLTNTLNRLLYAISSPYHILGMLLLVFQVKLKVIHLDKLGDTKHQESTRKHLCFPIKKSEMFRESS